ncbi:hypothetical protein IFT84_01175 [Rhizobium sp. CFBP 8762]|uniref:hypothetical protein n=1 Tax=Rhizobium sp. CFBP 8762 TaxID=2775279 RepID=UPI0017865665|nr:hypothetical protein [Rhizobium sp. CFBP 8762]MBD8553128.1 hypothetical protein [Rhizobium sp. CFBP 8762]
MNRHISIGSVAVRHSVTINLFGDTTMKIMARRLTIITLLLGVFAIALTAAVEADTIRRNQKLYGATVACVPSMLTECSSFL